MPRPLRLLSQRLAETARRVRDGLTGARPAAAESPRAATAAEIELGSVLIVDDEASTRLALGRYLKLAGHRVHTADGGEAALLAHSEHRPGIVLVDWMMPGMDGPELCRRLRGLDGGQFTYLVMLSGVSDKARLVEAFDAGVDDFVTKPCDPGELVARLRAGARIVALERELSREADFNRRLSQRLSRANKKLREMASTDMLTGLCNRRETTRRLGESFDAARRGRAPLAAVMMDLDGFKPVNDVLGHPAGDRLLKQIAAALKKSVRSSDVLGRLGGDEFVALMPGATAGEALRWAEQMRAAVTDAGRDFERSGLHVTISAGVAEIHDSTARAEELLDAADAALYAAKRAGKNGAFAAEVPTLRMAS